MTRCPDTGTLRASLDDEAAEADAHASACARCRDELAELRATAIASDSALALLAPPAAASAAASTPVSTPNIADARPPATRTSAAPTNIADARPPVAPTTGPPPNIADARPPAVPTSAAPTNIADARRRVAARSARASGWQRRAAAVAAVAVMAAGVVGTPAGRQAAADFLSAFRSERIEVVTVDPWSLAGAFWSLTELAEVEGADALELDPASSIAQAEERLGFPVSQPDPALLPERFAREPAEILTLRAREVRIDFDDDLVTSYLGANAPELTAPDGLGDTTLVVRMPNAVAISYRGPDFEQLVVGESELVTADTEGPLGLDEVRDFLLSLPSLPEATAQQLRAIEDWRTTLPLPVPADGPAWRDTTVAGNAAVLFDEALASAVVWQAEGRVRGVGGIADAATVRRIAEDVAR